MKFSIFNFQFFVLARSKNACTALLLCLAVALHLAACANPVPPSGGPRDTTPPAIAESSPEPRAVNVDTRTVQITFTEYVDPSSAQQALSVSPAPAAPLAFDWSGRTLEITFPEPLRENTTYLLTFDTQLVDVRGVELNEPITLAFGTGPQLNRGRLAGRVIGAARGAPVSQVDIYAYAAPDSTLPRPLPERPAYRTQTDPQGYFRFEYLREQPYYVIALRDRNRNRQPDPQETFAVPPRPVLFADSTVRTDTLRWVLAARDTIPPRPVNVQPRSRSRLTIRFDEPVRLTARRPADWTLTDSLAGTRPAVEAVYQQAETPAEIILRTEPLRPTPHRLQVPAGVVADTSGNRSPAATLRFTPPEARDTLQTRFLGFTPAGLTADSTGTYLLLPGLAPGVRFNQPVDSARLHQIVGVTSPGGATRRFTAQTPDGVTYRLVLSPPLQPEEVVHVAVEGDTFGQPDTTFTRTFQRISNRQLGELSGVVTAPDTAAARVVELHVVEPGPALPERAGPFVPDALRVTRTGPDGRFLFAELPEGTYRFRAFLDRDGDRQWDPGQLVPYQPAEPIIWAPRPLSVRPRWEVALEDTLRLSQF